WQIAWLEPRSTSSHCGSENALDQRLPEFPSVALEAGNEAFSSDDAVAGRFSARLVVPQLAARGKAGLASAATAAGAAMRLNDATMTGTKTVGRDIRSARTRETGLIGVLSVGEICGRTQPTPGANGSSAI